MSAPWHKHLSSGLICAEGHVAPNAEPTVPVTIWTDEELVEALATGLMDLDEHKWGGIASDRESLRVHYERDVERFLFPHLKGHARRGTLSGCES
jgi:hypothetical protein